MHLPAHYPLHGLSERNEFAGNELVFLRRSFALAQIASRKDGHGLSRENRGLSSSTELVSTPMRCSRSLLPVRAWLPSERLLPRRCVRREVPIIPGLPHSDTAGSAEPKACSCAHRVARTTTEPGWRIMSRRTFDAGRFDHFIAGYLEDWSGIHNLRGQDLNRLCLLAGFALLFLCGCFAIADLLVVFAELLRTTFLLAFVMPTLYTNPEACSPCYSAVVNRGENYFLRRCRGACQRSCEVASCARLHHRRDHYALHAGIPTQGRRAGARQLVRRLAHWRMPSSTCDLLWLAVPDAAIEDVSQTLASTRNFALQ